MGEPLASGTKKIDLAKSFICSYIIQRMIAVKTSEFGVVTYGAEETNNPLHNSEGSST